MRRRLASLTTAVAVVAAGLVVTVAAAAPAAADVPPGLSPVLSPTADQATADALPTVQVDGVVWSQAIVGNTVFAGGKFANARPAGAAAGTNLTPRANLLAYDLTTGVLKTTFAPPALNGQVLAVAASPDGKRIYAAGEFTNVGDNTKRNRVAAFDATTGALITTFNVNIGSRVKAIVATNDTVYVGGQFTSANGVTRTRLAAYAAANGALTAWAPVADNTVNALVLSPDKTKVYVGGAFASINGSPAYGLAAVDATTGDLLPFATGSKVQNSGANAAITSLSSDGTSLYGTGYVYGPGGNLEGTFQSDLATGSMNWVEDCHGDTYSAWASPSAVYTVSHAHYCGNIGGFFQSDPWSTNQRFALAFSKNATGTVGNDPYGYFNWAGNASPSLINWFPDFKTGTATGQNQAGWTVTGNDKYVVVGGEFPQVNGVGQQGIVRFATKPPAPGKSGPVLTGSKFTPKLVSLSQGSVRIAFQTNWDRDDMSLTYKIVRNSNTAAPIYTTTADSTYWNRPFLGYTDSNLAPGDYRYRLYVLDKDGNQVAGDTATITVPANGYSPSNYQKSVIAAAPSTYWRLGEPAGSTAAYDWVGYNDGIVGSGVSQATDGAVIGDTNLADTFDGSDSGRVTFPTIGTSPDVFTTSAWVKTTSTNGGKIIGFGNSQAGTSSSYDRHLYMQNSGQISFGVYDNGVRTVSSAKAYNDGQWHQVVSTLGPDGMALYVDGLRVGQRADVVKGNPYQGYWKVGGDNLGGWSYQPNSNNLAGSIDEVAIYPTVLTRDQVIAQYVASGRTSPVPPNPTDAYGAAVRAAQPTSYWRLDESSGSTAGDTGPDLNSGTFHGGYTLGAPGALNGYAGTAATFNGADGFVSSDAAYDNPTVYSNEIWFKTATNRGGKLIGFGNNANGSSSGYDRHIYMQDNGQLVFGTYTGQLNTITSPRSYNDNTWHQAVSTQGPDGMKLYVDGQLVGTNPQTQAQNYTGYWKVGGDNTWGSSSNYLDGTLDEVSIYPTVLSAGTVADHWSLGTTGALPNSAPTASFAATGGRLTASFDATASGDTDGTIASYAWNFGDGSTGSGATVTHPYTAAGTYTVTLTVTDDKGATAATTQTVAVTAPPANVAPVASFTTGSEGLTLSADASGSSDPDGSIASYAWDFGDGATGTGRTTSHVYGSTGTRTVTLTVTDDKGATTSTTQSVTVTAPPPNVPPTAAFTSAVAGLTVNVDGTGSTDTDGTIASYAWAFGDGGTSTDATAVHTYTAGGTYTVTLTVTDNSGASTSKAATITVVKPPPANVAPTAAFTSTVTNLGVALNGSTSTDTDGTIASYAWDFGDNTNGSGATTQHTYLAAGTYTVALTVTDNAGATNTVSKAVTVTNPATPTAYATDLFERAVVNGLGSADTGGVWTLNGTAAQFAVNGGQARLKINTAGSGPLAWLNTVSAADLKGSVDFTYDKAATGGGTYTSVAVRRVGTSDYRFKVRIQPTSVQVQLSKVVNGVETTLRTQTIAGMTWAPGDTLRLAFQAQGAGSTVLSAKAWKVGTAEPAAWQATVTDTQAELQGPGAVGVQTYLAGSATNAPVVASFDNLTIGTLPTP
ncbi:PKD domain-containing protein [Nakamurella flavida]|uniref:PKD domain-containing protein n=1 Tax=Nakamurella flavida TaxID=363630 RepID=A0A938YLF8_9ACTN|nr:PKD domain-containing protein [Nakamurella flavida]